jgi:hypothetical protein
MVRWRQARFSEEQIRIAKAVFSPMFFDAATAPDPRKDSSREISAFAGANLASDDISSYLASFPIGAKS